MLDMLKNNKKLLLITLIVVIIVVVLLFLSFGGAKEKKKFSCSRILYNDDIKTTSTADFYTKNDNVIFRGHDKYEFASNTDERAFSLIYFLTILSHKYGEDIAYIQFNDNVVDYYLNIDFSALTSEEVYELTKFKDLSLTGLRSTLEGEGYRCEDF